MLSGIAAAAVYVPLTGGIARWFPSSERGLSTGTLGGVGGAFGEGAAYALLPILSIYFASGWRQGMHMIAAAIAVMGVLALLLLRSAPSVEAATTRKPFEWRLLGDPEVWCYAFLWSGFVIGIRIAQMWIAVYAADVYISGQGMSARTRRWSAAACWPCSRTPCSDVRSAVPLAGQHVGCARAPRNFADTVVLMAWLVLGTLLRSRCCRPA